MKSYGLEVGRDGKARCEADGAVRVHFGAGESLMRDVMETLGLGRKNFWLGLFNTDSQTCSVGQDFVRFPIL